MPPFAFVSLLRKSLFLTLFCKVTLRSVVYVKADAAPSVGALCKMAQEGLSPSDPSSFSRPDLALVTSIHLSLDVNFERKILSGCVDLTVKKVAEGVKEVVLDAKDLNISGIYEKQSKEKLGYTVSEPRDEFGSKLTVALPERDPNSIVITVCYETNPNASGLQWLSPEQTAGKLRPFVFSQFQAIHARSVIPCQDTPAVKTKYSADILAPSDLTVVMSAICDRKESTEDKIRFHFEQSVPVQSYLIAIAVGALESREIGPRSKVWSEKENIEAAKYEFADTERQLRTAEEICGPYVWGIYDLLVLPPSFPFGGMENPCLTFVTPTLLAGDRSLANVIAHEIAHSWTGNLVTNRNFEHFWLNEGFTVFIERKILGRLESKELQEFQAYGGLVELKATVNRLGHENPITKLVVDLKGVNPDDVYSIVPYEKGQIFLRYLESVVGGADQFEPFLRKYFDTYKFQSITTDDFKSFFESHFAQTAEIKDIDWNTWLYEPGMPPVIPNFDMTLTKAVKTFIKTYSEWDGNNPAPFTAKDVERFIPEQVIQLLQLLLEEGPQSIQKLAALEEVFKFDSTKNSEIKFRWLRIGLKAHWTEKIGPSLKWITEVGRMKFVRPLYRDLYQWEASRPQAIEVFNQNKREMMHVCASGVAQDLHLI